MRVSLRVPLLALLFCALAAGGTVYGQTIGSGPHAAQIPAGAFFQTTLSTEWGAKFYLYPNSANAVELRAPVDLPSGANIFTFGLYYYDASATGDVTAELWSIPGDTSLDPELIGTATSGTSAGYGYAAVIPGSINYTVHNDVANDVAGAHVYIVVHLPADAQADAAFKAVDLRYNTTISAPPPFVPTFLDVPQSHPFYQYIEALAKGEITAGCGDFNYCPDAPVTRGQMAVFISKALGLYWP
jgi:hypothetical protein